jgi:hypothetical protein
MARKSRVRQMDIKANATPQTTSRARTKFRTVMIVSFFINRVGLYPIGCKSPLRFLAAEPRVSWPPVGLENWAGGKRRINPNVFIPTRAAA